MLKQKKEKNWVPVFTFLYNNKKPPPIYFVAATSIMQIAKPLSGAALRDKPVLLLTTIFFIVQACGLVS